MPTNNHDAITQALDSIESDLSGLIGWTNHGGFNVPDLANTDRQAQETLWNIKAQLAIYERSMMAKIRTARARAH